MMELRIRTLEGKVYLVSIPSEVAQSALAEFADQIRELGTIDLTQYETQELPAEKNDNTHP